MSSVMRPIVTGLVADDELWRMIKFLRPSLKMLSSRAKGTATRSYLATKSTGMRSTKVLGLPGMSRRTPRPLARVSPLKMPRVSVQPGTGSLSAATTIDGRIITIDSLLCSLSEVSMCSAILLEYEYASGKPWMRLDSCESS